MGNIIVIVLVFVALIKFPRVSTAVAFTMVSFMFVENGSIHGGELLLFASMALLTLGLQISPRMGGIRMLISHKAPDKRLVIKHMIFSFIVSAGGLLIMVLISLALRYHGGTIGFLLILALNPIAGFFVAVLIQSLAEGIWGTDDEIDEGHRQQKFEAEQKKLAAEREAERQRIEAEREAEQQRQAAEAEAQRKRREAERAAEMQRIEANQAAILSFWDLMISDYRVHPGLKSLALGGHHFNVNLVESSEVWVRNDERIKKIEDILRSAGFHVGTAIGGRLTSEILPGRGFEERTSPYPFESPFLDDILYSEYPIESCAQNFICAAAGRQHISGDGWLLPDEYTYGFHDCMDEMMIWVANAVNRCLEDYKREYEIIKSGLMGEYAVQEILDMHAGAFLVLHDLRLEFPGDPQPISVETDTLVLAPNGIFAVEVKNYGGSGRYKIVVTGDGNWYKEYPARYEGESPKREPMSNPFAQNDRHVAYLERFINELLGRGMENWAHVANIICISNDTVTLENDPAAKQTLTRVSNLYNNLTSDRNTRFSVDELNQIKQALEAKALPGKKYPLVDHSENLQILSQYYNFLISNRFSVITAASLCAKDHPEFLTMIK